MKTALKINWILTILLSVATGVFKLLGQEADILLFEKIGFNSTMTTLLGAIQLAGGIMLLFPKTRISGAWIMIFTFILASIAVFANGMIAFGLVSLIFIAMSGLVIFMERAASRS